MEMSEYLCLKLSGVIMCGKSRLSGNNNQVIYFSFSSGLCKKNCQVALGTGKAVSSASDNVTDTGTNVVGFLTRHIG